MKFFDYIRFALKNLWRQRLRSGLTIFAIVIGAMSVISMISLVLGASNVFLQQIESAGSLSNVTVSANKDANPDDILNNRGQSSADAPKLDDATVAKLKKLDHVIDASGTTYADALQVFQIKDDPTQKKYVIDGVQAYTPGPATDKVVEAGRNLLPSDDKGMILLDADEAAKIGYKNNPQDLVGKTLVFTTRKGYTGDGATILTPKQTDNNGGFDPDLQKQQQEMETTLEAKVIGVTQPGPFGGGGAYVTASWAKKMMENQFWGLTQDEQDAWNQQQKAMQQAQQEAMASHTPYHPAQVTPPAVHLVVQDNFAQRGYNSITLKVDSASDAAPVAAKVKDLGYGAATAQDFLDSIMKIFKIVGAVFGAIGAISLFVASIGVVNTMVMATLERTREIGVMRACGATKAAVRRLFTFEAALLGFWGGAVGIGLGYVLGKVANIVANNVLAKQHIGATNIIQLPWWLAVAVIAATTVIGMLSGLAPAYRAAKLNPVEALRYE